MPVSPKLSVENWAGLWCGLEWAFEGPVPESSLASGFYGKCFRAWLLRRGECLLRFTPRHRPDEQRRLRLSAGEWLFIPAGEGFQEFSDDAEILSISFTARWPAGEPLLAPADPCRISASRVPELWREGRKLAQACGEHPHEPHQEFDRAGLPLRSLCVINARLYSWLGPFLEAAQEAGWVLQAPTDADPRLAAALRMMEEHPLAEPLHMPRLAKECGLSVSQLNRLFRRRYGQTPAAFFAGRKKEFARGQVLHGKMPLKEVCYSLGFSAPSHFTNWFRKEFGCAPSRFAKEQEDSA